MARWRHMSQVLSLGVLLLVSSLAAAEDDSPLVETALGKVRGKWLTSRSGRKFAAFQGIPYAKPPVGKLRFQAPEPAEGWNGTRDATNEGPVCLQYLPSMGVNTVLGQEDCLYLSVYTHNISGAAPVIAHIHGGGFAAETSAWYKPTFLMDEDLVIVNIDYRLGMFGFLTFETEELRGNQGLKDQLLALEWIKKNIASFGGNPDSVTLNGESAGGASVHFHTVSPRSKGLFHRVISESGTAYSPWALTVPGVARSAAEKLMTTIGCPTDPKEAKPCLITKDAVELTTKYGASVMYVPSLEPPGPDAFISGPVSKWSHSPVPMLIGQTSGEGIMFSLGYLDKWEWLTQNFSAIAPQTFMYQYSAPRPEEITPKVREFYLKNKELSMKDYVNFTTLFTDVAFTIPIMEAANRHNGDVYYYYFDYILKGYPGLPDNETLIFGTLHAQEIRFFWDCEGGIYQKLNFREEDEKLSKQMTKLVSKFARDGNMDNAVEGLEWKKWTEKDRYYVHLDQEREVHLKKDLAQDRFDFWKSLDYRSNYDKNNSVGYRSSAIIIMICLLLLM